MMKTNVILLTAGVALSIVSKWLQFRGKADVGDLLVFPAAVFLVLGGLFSWPQYEAWLNDQDTRGAAKMLGAAACTGIVSFQLMAWFVFGRKLDIGFLFLIPVFISIGGVVWFWIRLKS